MGKKDEAFDSDEEWGGESNFDIEGEDDIPHLLHNEDLRDFKYGVSRKFAFAEDEDVNLKKIKYIFRELLIDLGLGKFDRWSLITSFLVIVFSLWS